jgi:hypothetical protein
MSQESLKLDGAAMLQEALNLIKALQDRVIVLAGRVGALEKQLAERAVDPPAAE